MCHLYGKVKSYSPLLKYGLETVEHHIPAAITKLGNPVIDGLDVRLDHIRETASNVFSPVQKTYAGLKGKATEKASKVLVPVKETYKSLDADQDGKVSLADVKTSAATKTTELVSRTNAKWKDLRGEMTKKTTERLEKGLGKVCEFSATRGKEIIHVDLIQYCREVIDGASTTVSHKLHDASDVVKPLYEPAYYSICNGVLKLNEARHQLQEAVTSLPSQTLEQAKAARDNLRLRLRAALQAARELSTSGVSFVHTKYGAATEAASKIPKEMISHLPLSAQKSVDFLLASPELFARIKEKADVDTSKRTLDNISNLLGAMKEVLLARPGEDDLATRGEPKAT
jgi:hypothetical protein